MKAVMDLLFLEELEFEVPAIVAGRALAVQDSLSLAITAICESVGIELVDYDRMTVSPGPPGISTAMVRVFSRAYREKAERANATAI